MDPILMMLLFGFGSAALSAFGTGMTNATNENIANQNLASQEKWNQIQFDYNKELQQKLFDRADTAYIQQASQLSQLGINPAGSQLSGTQVGAAIPQSVTAPQKNFQAISPDFSGLNGMSGMLSALDGMETNSVSRDSMRQTAKYNEALTQEKLLQNLITANKNDIGFDEDGMPYLLRGFDNKEQDFNKVRYTDENASAERNERVNNFQKSTRLNDSVTDSKIVDPAFISTMIKTAAQEEKDNAEKYGKEYRNPLEIVKDSLSTAVNSTGRGLKQIGNNAKETQKKSNAKAKEIWNSVKKGYSDGMNWITNKIKNW